MQITKFLTSAILCLASFTANAATTVWTPTDNDVNFSFGAQGIGDTNIYALFDVDDFDDAQANALVLSEPADTIDFTAGADYTITSAVTSNSITLFGDNEFVIASSDDNGVTWMESMFYLELAPNSNIYNIEFETGTVLSIDAVPHVVPVPAAAWLFASGLFGVVAVARRKA